MMQRRGRGVVGSYAQRKSSSKMQTSRHLLLTEKGRKRIRQKKFPNVTRLRYSAWSEILPTINNLKKYNIYDKELHSYDFLTYHVEPEQVNFKSENCFKLQI